MPLYRSLSNCLCFDLRNSKRTSNACLQCEEKCSKENNFSKMLQKSNELIDKYYKSLNQEYNTSDVPQSIIYFACTSITNCVFNIFKKDKDDLIYLWFSSNEVPDKSDNETSCTINLLEDHINEETIYMPIFSFESFFLDSLLSDNHGR